MRLSENINEDLFRGALSTSGSFSYSFLYLNCFPLFLLLIDWLKKIFFCCLFHHYRTPTIKYKNMKNPCLCFGLFKPFFENVSPVYTIIVCYKRWRFSFVFPWLMRVLWCRTGRSCMQETGFGWRVRELSGPRSFEEVKVGEKGEIGWCGAAGENKSKGLKRAPLRSAERR